MKRKRGRSMYYFWTAESAEQVPWRDRFTRGAVRRARGWLRAGVTLLNHRQAVSAGV